MSQSEYVKTKPFIVSILILASSFILVIGGPLIIQNQWALIPVVMSAPVFIIGILYGLKYA